MSADAEFSVPKRSRRSQAERTADTRRRVIDAVIDSIADVGFSRTTGTEIARRAGVSWGAVQHHFGDKNGVLAAALLETFNHLVEVLGEPDEHATSIEARAELFVDRAWTHFSSGHYRTAYGIFLDLRTDVESLDEEMTERQISTWTRIWRRYFPDSRLTRRQTADIMNYCVVVLSGLATTETIGHRDARTISRALDFLKDTLTRELSDG